MYINPFILGVISTLGAEVIALIVYAFVRGRDNNNE